MDDVRAALEPFAEIARRLGWDRLDDDDMALGDHVVEAPADDIAPGATYCLMVGAFRRAARLLDELEVIGTRAVKLAGDYTFEGEVRAVVFKKSGAVRYVVEDDRGLLLIMNAEQIGFIDELLDKLPVITKE